MELPYNLRFAIIGGGNIGQAIARGLVESGKIFSQLDNHNREKN